MHRSFWLVKFWLVTLLLQVKGTVMDTGLVDFQPDRVSSVKV